MHVKGFTKLHPGIPEPLRGTYAALTTEPALEHLLKLGVTAVELMPVHYPSYDRHLVERGLFELLGLQHARLLCALDPVFVVPGQRGGVDSGVQTDGEGAAQRRPRSDPRRRLQPHR
jgi:hypothetical protein